MKIIELLEDDNQEDQSEEPRSEYVSAIRSTLIDYLTSLSATGAKGQIQTSKVVNFLSELGYDVNAGQIADLLDDTAFSATSTHIKINQSSDKIEKDAEKTKDFNKKKVSNMADNQLDKEIEGDSF